MELEQELEFIGHVIRGGNVSRWGCRTIIGQQRNDAHQWSVFGITDYSSPTISKAALRYAAYHDSPEELTGDFNGHWKASCDRTLLEPLLAPAEALLKRHCDIADDEKHIVKLADKLSDIMFLSHQKMLGNQTLEEPLANTIDKFVAMWWKPLDNDTRHRMVHFIIHFKLDHYNLLERLT